MLTGWIKLGDKWYYAEPSGAMKNGWFKYKGYWYFLHGNGEMAVGMIEDAGKIYYLNQDGIMLTGWIKQGENWLYAEGSGTLRKGWTEVDGRRYFINNDYIMVTGENVINDKQYFFHDNGNLATFEFIGEKYYGKDGILKDINNGEKFTIVIDPGHNFGGDDGAYARHNGITYIERDLNMQISLKLKLLLEEYGYNVVLTRYEEDRLTEGVRPSLERRANLANSLDTDLYLSIHHDSNINSNVSGLTVFYSSYKSGIDNTGIYYTGDIPMDKSPSKASVISRDFAANLSNKLSVEMNYINRGVKDNNLFVTKNTNMPSVLIECGFISNPNEAKRAASHENQQQMAIKIVEEVNRLFRK